VEDAEGLVEDNSLAPDPATSCVATEDAGSTTAPIQGLSHYREWSCRKTSPSSRDSVQRNITTPASWHMLGEQAERKVGWEAWRSAPDGQGVDSTKN
jgi:hypothetical protein